MANVAIKAIQNYMSTAHDIGGGFGCPGMSHLASVLVAKPRYVVKSGNLDILPKLKFACEQTYLSLLTD